MKNIATEDLIIRKSYAMPFDGGEIWIEQLDSLSDHTDIVKEKFLNDMKYICKTSTPSKIVVNLYETMVTRGFAERMVDELCRASHYITKVAFVGIDKATQKVMKLRFQQTSYSFLYKFFEDFELAKEWLIKEGI